MKRQVQVYIRPDVYEVTLEGNVIIRTIRYMGESGYPHEVDFNNLDQKKQDIIIAAILESND